MTVGALRPAVMNSHESFHTLTKISTMGKQHTSSSMFNNGVSCPVNSKRPGGDGICVYGYRGHFNDAIKPLLLLYLASSAIGTTVLAVLFKDATRPFLLSTVLHLFPEVLVWTHLLFPPHTQDGVQGDKWRTTIRWVYTVGCLILLLGPVSPSSGVAQPIVTLTYLAMAGMSDMLGVWLGLLMMVRRTHKGARRLGVVFFVHGLAFHLTAYEFFAPDNNAFGSETPVLQGFGWIVLLAATTAAFYSCFPIFSEPLDMRKEAPSRGEFRFLAGGMALSLLGIPFAATGGDTSRIVQHILHPVFLPRDPAVLTVYKIVFPIASCILLVQLLIRYVDSGLPILPLHRSRHLQATKQKLLKETQHHVPIAPTATLSHIDRVLTE